MPMGRRCAGQDRISGFLRYRRKRCSRPSGDDAQRERPATDRRRTGTCQDEQRRTDRRGRSRYHPPVGSSCWRDGARARPRPARDPPGRSSSDESRGSLCADAGGISDGGQVFRPVDGDDDVRCLLGAGGVPCGAHVVSPMAVVPHGGLPSALRPCMLRAQGPKGPSWPGVVICWDSIRRVPRCITSTNGIIIRNPGSRALVTRSREYHAFSYCVAIPSRRTDAPSIDDASVMESHSRAGMVGMVEWGGFCPARLVGSSAGRSGLSALCARHSLRARSTLKSAEAR